MSLISQIFYAVVITSFTGTAALGIWVAACKVLDSRSTDLLYLILRCVCPLYLLPVTYLLIQLTAVDGYLLSDGLWQMNFSAAGVMMWLYLLCELVWGILTVRGLICYVRQAIQWSAYQRGCFPEEDERVRQEFLAVKESLGIRRHIDLCRNPRICSAMITGIVRCRVILPIGEYTKEQLRVTFFHELMHYKSHDLWYKFCGICIGAVHCWNPLAGKLLCMLNEWSEYDCDRKVLDAMEGMTAARYFEVILEVMKPNLRVHDKGHIFSMLIENQTSLERRIEHMKKYSKTKKTGKLVSALLALAFVLTSVTTAYAAGTEMADVQAYINRQTERTSSINDIEMVEGMIFIPAGSDGGYKEWAYANPEAEVIMPVLGEEEMASFEWVVPPDMRYVSSKISLETGQKVSVSCSAIPASSTYWIGIMNGWGDVWYYEGYGSLGCNFHVNASGSYRVLVQNRSEVDITAAGHYYYFTPI